MYANRLAVVILDENVSTRDVADLAKLDPSLVGVVLKTVNSAFYGFKRKISDFQHAVLLLGFNQVYQLVMDVGLRNTMPKTPEFRELQLHAMVVSFISLEIAQLCQMKRAVAVSTTGLLHDVGKSVVMLLKAKYPKMDFLIDLLDHTKLGSLLLKEWNIPDVVCQGLEYQAHPEWLPPDQIPEAHRKEVAVLYISHLVYDFLTGKKEEDLPVTFLPQYLRLLRRSESSIRQFVEKMILPILKKKQATFPEDMRSFIITGEEYLTGNHNQECHCPPDNAPSKS
jgi:HD-like signal output (HDOD) protein